MARLPVVAIIGRPNTGKSTLFNALTGSRRAIVSDIAGTTRDPVATKVVTDELDYLLLDTGGLGGGSTDTEFEKDAALQSRIALGTADLVLFTLDGRTDLTASDHEVISMLRKERKRHVPVIIVATKCDKRGIEQEAIPEFLSLGITEDVLPVAAVHMQGIGELEDTMIERLKQLHFTKEKPVSGDTNTPAIPRIAVIGRPNVGKSSLLNALMSAPQRKTSARIVSDIPGTTRDVTDTIIVSQERPYVFVDTAGLRRRARVDEKLEYLSYIQSMHAIEDCDVAVLMLDGAEPPSHQDKRIAGLAIDEGKALIILINKEDLLTSEQKKQRTRDIAAAFPFCRFAPILYVSAKERTGLLKLFPLLESCYRNRLRRIPTRELRAWYLAAVRGVPARMLAGGKHITQATDPPPTFVLFVRNPRAIELSQLRYLDNRLRETFGFEGTPVRWVTRKG